MVESKRSFPIHVCKNALEKAITAKSYSQIDLLHIIH